MSKSGSSLRNVSDTAIWVAALRARETERQNGLIRDPFARRLAGERGEEIARELRSHSRHQWAYATRTWLFDKYVRERVDAGAGLVLNLAAGLDARPYRMDLPSSLHWIDADLPGITEYRDSILRDDRPACRRESVAIDLADREQRRALFARVASESKQALVMSEGLLIYLGEDGVRALAEDLAAHPSFHWWAIDLASPVLLRMMKREVGTRLDDADAPLKFAPKEGPWFFESCGWRVADVQGTAKNAIRLTKVPLMLRFISALFRETRPPRGPWAGVCLLANRNAV